MFVKAKTVTLFVLTIILVISCASKPEITKMEIVDQEQKTNDYLDKGVVLAGLRFYSWEDTICMAKVYPVKMVIEASEATMNQAKVLPMIDIREVKDTSTDTWSWTKFVFKSHPAKQDELKKGMWILCVNADNPLEENSLREQIWEYRKINSIDEIFKGLIEVTYYSTYYSEQRTSKIFIQNVRIVENPVSDDMLGF